MLETKDFLLFFFTYFYHKNALIYVQTSCEMDLFVVNHNIIPHPEKIIQYTILYLITEVEPYISSI